MEGVVRLPSEFGMTTGSPPSMTATQELVVPRSIPITFAMLTRPAPSQPLRQISSADADVCSQREVAPQLSHCLPSGEGAGGAAAPDACAFVLPAARGRATTTAAGRTSRS